MKHLPACSHSQLRASADAPEGGKGGTMVTTAYVRVNIVGKPIYEFSPYVLLHQVDVVQELNQHYWCYPNVRI
jgi:hypothetical protein